MTDEPFVSFASRVLSHAGSFPDQRAVVCDHETLSYGALVLRARRGAERLRAFGLEPGGTHRVGIIASNGLDFVVVVVACQVLGVTVVPLPGLITPDALARMIDDAGVTIVFHDADHAEKASAAVGLGRDPGTIALVAMGGRTATDGSTALDRWLATDPLVTSIDIDPQWTSDLIYSSGTTGVPKGIVQSYRGRSAQNASLASIGVTAGSHLLQTVGLYSNFGMSSLYLTLWCGGTLFIMHKFSAAASVSTLATEPIDNAWFAPATLVRTLETPGFEESVRNRRCTKLCAGAPLGATTKEQVLAIWPGAFFDLYGQTETGTLTLLAAHAAPASKLGSVGTLLSTVSVRIIDDAGHVLPPDTEGEIAGHSTTLMSSYHARRDADAAALWTDELGRRYVRTGDIGRLDADGYLWLSDRKKDMIISGGFNIYPADIERVLQGHPAVLEVAVVGCASARWGETPVAFVSLRLEVTADEETLREWVNSRVARIQRVAAVRILASLPSGTMGKILKRELRDRYANALGTLP
ncbi:MAG: class I adenylate-forming enzyme family protein [Gemmatimonadota bacterium]